jgi:outer membrane receptor for monomeric catechols
MMVRMLRTITVIAVVCSEPFAAADAAPRHSTASVQGSETSPRSAGALKDHRRPSAGSYKTDRLSSSRGEKILDTPGQTTVLTRQVLDDMKATSLRDALRSTAGVTVGR